jgi:hypothetical protein
MRVYAVIVSETEAEIHHIPSRVDRFFGRRHTYSPIMRKLYENTSGLRLTEWYHTYSGRPLSQRELCLLETLAPLDTMRVSLLLAAAEEAENT